jgi:mono/diheme cytochrome c family protein
MNIEMNIEMRALYSTLTLLYLLCLADVVRSDEPAGQVLATLSDGLPASDRWLREGEQWPNESMRWTNEAFLIHRLPFRYDDWGIRDAWQETVLLRMAADVEFPAGKHRLLMRTRGMGRLWIDGELITKTNPITHKSPDGEQPITPLAEPPLPGVRPHGYRQQEVFAEVDMPESKRCRVVLELIIGGKDQRTEPGEACVAVKTDGRDSYELLTPVGTDVVPLTDAAVNELLVRMETNLSSLDDTSRRHAASSQNAYWEDRHRMAKQWAAENPAPVVPSINGNSLANPVDAFIANKITDAIEAAANSDRASTRQFYGQVLPILSEKCFRCHGEKQKGGLKLNSRKLALRAGDSKHPAIVPGDPNSSNMISQVRSGAMPPTEAGLSEKQIGILEQWIRDGAAWPAPPVDQQQVASPPSINDESFLRRVYLDTVGLPPTLAEADRFLSDTRPDKRQRLIDERLDDERLADHWISLWQDLLAENPTLLNQSMGSTGPFRWFLHESLRDNKPLDRMVTELIMMRGSPDTGGSAGFSMSGESDAPFAEKAHILVGAFLGVELRCARCHDSPYHSTTQRDLYSLAAMLERKTVKVPATSRVPVAFFEKKGRESLIRVTLKSDESIAPEWPLAGALGFADGPALDSVLLNADDSRERLAMLITSPQNPRFGQVMVNRVWKQLMGAGFVESVSDWEGQTPSHPELLDWLVRELTTNGYDLRVVMRQIMTSQTYQREAIGQNAGANSEQRFFAAPDRRRLTAEQIVDSLYLATGSEMDVEELTFVHDGQRPIGKRQSLGCPKRAWMFASLNNERDRPSLSLPRARAVTDVLQAFGWSGSRQKPISARDTEPNVLQPGILSNGALAMTLTRASLNSELSKRAIEATTAESLVDEWFRRVLCRQPSVDERQTFSTALREGFDNRLVPAGQVQYPEPLPQLPLVTWFNHLQGETNTIQQELERRVNIGPPPDPRLDVNWRATYEDFVWSLINHREFVWVP